MGFTPEQIKGRIKSVAKQNNADARTLMRIYMMERFLERLAQSEYRDNFIIKGGILVTAMIGVAHRSTMDIDTSMKNLNLSAEDALRVVNQVKDIDLDDGVSFEVKDVSNIMDEMEYPGIRVTMNANVGRLITPLKIDISTGDVITPRAIEFNYDLLLEDRSISLWSYNLETILAEKLQTVLARGILNTRMRDFYDIRMLAYYLGASTYGTIENRILNQMQKLQPDDGAFTARTKRKYLLSRIFPGREWCKAYAPTVYKYPVLLPFFWVWRLIYKGITNRKKVTQEIKTIKAGKQN